MSLKQRMRFHGILRFLLRVDRISKGIKVRKLNSKTPKIPENRQAIFVLTHVGRDDIAIFNEVVGEHYTIVEKQDISKDRPVIFACTHGFWKHFFASLLTVGEDFYVLFGNRKQALRSTYGFCAFVTGIILVDRFDKKEEHPKTKWFMHGSAVLSCYISRGYMELFAEQSSIEFAPRDTRRCKGDKCMDCTYCHT